MLISLSSQQIIQLMGVLSSVISFLIKVLSYVPVYIYNLVYSRFYTRWTYYMVADRLESRKLKINKILDVGIGTGHPMKQIIHRIPSETQVVGIDIDKNYLRYAVQTFASHKNVEIRYQNFYDLENANEKYDVIIFSSSFMIMPDRVRALEIAKDCLKPGGSIFFLLTLENEKSNKTLFLEKVKPYLKYLTTVEFGTITYERDFELMLTTSGLDIDYKQQVGKKSIFLWLFRMFVVETRIRVSN